MNLYLIFLILIALAALFLIMVIMVQNPKGGGLDSTFGGGSGMMLGGVKQTTDFLEKATWTLFGIMIGLILLSNTIIFKQTEKTENIVTPETQQVEQPVQPQNQNGQQPLNTQNQTNQNGQQNQQPQQQK